MTTEQEQFVKHLQELLLLTDVQRCRRPDWQAIKQMLSDKGYWRRRKPPVSTKRQEQAAKMRAAKQAKINDIIRDRDMYKKKLKDKLGL